jgi:enoyl-CoA hydratase
MPPTFSTLSLDRRDNGILLVTLNRPEAANAMNMQLGASWCCSRYLD